MEDVRERQAEPVVRLIALSEGFLTARAARNTSKASEDSQGDSQGEGGTANVTTPPTQAETEMAAAKAEQRQELLNIIKLTLAEVGRKFKFDFEDKDSLLKKLKGEDGILAGVPYIAILGFVANAILQCLFQNTDIIFYGEAAFGHSIKLPNDAGTDYIKYIFDYY